jgi:4-amino-4-deoxy-L-arabinose transferase-like glycosyltransferase
VKGAEKEVKREGCLPKADYTRPLTLNTSRLTKGEYLVLCGLLAISIVSAFWMLPAITLEDHECFVSVTAREMVESGNWILPTMNGRPRINKTPLSYWIVAGLGKITGHINEFTTRLPSAVFAVLSAVIVFCFVYQWLGFRIAAVSSAVWSTSLAYVRCSHLGRSDMAVSFFITLCLLSFYSAVNSESRGKQIIYALIFWASFGLGNLAKGPAPVPLVLLPVFFFILLNRKWAVLPKMMPIVGIFIFLAIMLPWPLIVAYKVNWNLVIWKREFVDRLVGEYLPGNYPIYFYFLMMFKYIAPWFVFLPIALIAPFYKVWTEKRDVMKYLWLWFVVDIVFLTIDLGKRQHYILPLMPSMAVLVGILLDDMVFCRRGFTADFVRRLGKVHIFAVIVSIIGGIVFTVIFKPQFLQGVIILCLFAAAMTGAIVLLFYKGKLKTALAFSFVFASLLFMVYVWFNTEYVDDSRPIREFAQQITLKVPKNENLIAYKEVSSTFVYYYGKVVPVIKDIQELFQHYQEGDWIEVNSKYVEALRKDSRFNNIYYEPSRKDLRADASGGLFHISNN